MTALYVSHNLALLAVLCDELRILYAGQVVEAGSAEQVYFTPEHPYTAGLVAAVPHHLDDKPVRGIGGTPPQSVVLDTCAFGPRCGYRTEGCAVPVPLIFRPNGREVRCVRAGEPALAAARVTEPAFGNGAAAGLPPAVSPPSLLTVTGVSVSYTHAGRSMTALDNLSLSIGPGEVVGVVGESGSGKSTLLRALAGLLAPRVGTLEVNGAAVPWPVGRRDQDIRREIQIVFQNPDASLNPRQSVGAIVDHPLRKFRPGLDRVQRARRILEVFGQLRLSPDLLDRYPAALSGGQRQRVALARALVADPAVVLCDEITSALDVSVQASILELLGELRRASGLAMIFVTHDLGVLRAVADRALVLEAGHVREIGIVSQLLEAPRHVYTATLVRSIPDPAAHHAEQHPGGSDETRVPRRLRGRPRPDGLRAGEAGHGRRRAGRRPLRYR
jgi:peptide/nickel transport system ATP-binding protein